MAGLYMLQLRVQLFETRPLVWLLNNKKTSTKKTRKNAKSWSLCSRQQTAERLYFTHRLPAASNDLVDISWTIFWPAQAVVLVTDLFHNIRVWHFCVRHLTTAKDFPHRDSCKKFKNQLKIFADDPAKETCLKSIMV